MTSYDWLHSGIPFHIPGHGGPDCIAYLTTSHRLIETLVQTLLSTFLLLLALRHIKPAQPKPVPVSLWRPLALGGFALVFGVEIGFKLASNQVLWLLNPCHLLSAIQLLLLLLPVTPATAALYRLQLYWVTGALLALVFPVTNGLLFNGEVKVYWLQHLLLLVAPLPLLSQGVELPSDWSWPAAAFSLFSLFHWLVLQPIGLITGANLNNMLCPPVSLPPLLTGPHYRSFVMLIMAFLIPIIGKSYPIIVSFVSTKVGVIRNTRINNNNKEK